MYVPSVLLLAASLLQGASALPPILGSTPIPPSEDPWYSAPRGFESAAPGEILRIRAAPGNLTTVVGNASAAYNILYRTTNSLYKPSWAVTTLLVPPLSAAAAAANGSSLLSYQIAYDSFDVNASPSYAMYTDPSTDIATALKLGWFVNVPDFEGPLASFTAGVASGHATLDSVRAVLSSGFGLDEHARYALWGYSGGALASEWAAELQGQYAPELTFSGAAVGGLTPNITNVMDSVSGTLSAGLVPAAILGISSQHPDTYAYIVSQLKPNGTYNRARFLATKDLDLDEAELYYLEQDIFDYFVDGYETFYNPVVQKALNQDGYMGYHGVPQMPVFAYKAINDEVSPIADSDQLIARYCGVGVNILYERNTVGGHSAEEVNSDARAWAWLTSIFDGTYASKYATSGCTIRNVTLNITSSPL